MSNLKSTLLATISALPLSGLALIAAPQQALAANECGPAVAGVVVCSGPNYPAGIAYTAAGPLTVTLDNSSMTITGVSISARLTGSVAGNLVINATEFQTVSSLTTGVISVANSATGGGAFITMDSGSATGGANFSGGTLQATSQSNGTSHITLNGGAVVATAAGGNSLFASAGGAGTATVEMNGGAVTSNGNGLVASGNSFSTASANAIIDGGTVQAVQNGVSSQSFGGSATTTMTGGAVTSGGNGLMANITGSAAATDAMVSMQAGNVVSTGTGGAGIFARNVGRGAAAIEMTGGTVTATGNNSDGILAQTTNAAGTVDVTVSGGTVTGGTGNGAAIHTVALAGGSTLAIGAGATIDGSASGVAIRDGDANRDGVDENNGSVTITSAGTLIGGIWLGGGTDALTVTGGSIAGDITGDGADSLVFDLGAGSFAYDALYATTGMASVAMNSGSAAINGTIATDVLTVNGGKLILNNLTTATTSATVNGGMLVVGDAGSSGAQLTTSALDVLAGAGLQGIGTIVGDVNNAGLVAPGNSIGTLTIAGDYSGAGGLIEIETQLGDDSSPTDRLVITGNTSGSSNVRVTNVGGTGNQTVEGIQLIDVGGLSAGTFALLGDYVFEGEQAVIGGAYAYRLYQGSTSDPSDGDWYLRSELVPVVPPPGPGPGPAPAPTPLYAPGVPLYEAYAGVLQSFNAPGTLQQRVGNRFEVDNSATKGTPIWGRIEASHAELAPGTSTTGAKHDVDTWKLQAGIDMPLLQSELGALVGGITGHYGTVSSEVSSRFGDGAINATGYGLGGTLTWYGDSGFYVDAQTTLTWYDADLSSSTLGTALASGNNGFGYALSLEAGQKVALNDQWSVTPQAQLAHSSVWFDDFTDPYGAAVSLDDADSLLGRLGVSVDYENEWKDATGQTSRSHAYGIANLYYDFLDGSSANVAGTRIASQDQSLWAGIGIGGSLSLSDDRLSLNGEAFARTSLENFGDSNALGAKLGLSVKW